MAFEIADHIKKVCHNLEIPFIFKGSYRKANRSRLDSFTGIGDKKALAVLQNVGSSLRIPTITDIHTPEEAALAAKFVDVYRFLLSCADKLIYSLQQRKQAKNSKYKKRTVSLFRGHAICSTKKVKDSGNNNVLLTERVICLVIKIL